MVNPIDWEVEKEWQRLAKNHNIKIMYYANPAFLNSEDDLKNYFANKKNYFLYSFYIHQRKKWQILMKEGKPRDGKWSYDKENRQPLSRDISIPSIPKELPNAYIREAVKYTDIHFPNNPGEVDSFIFPISHQRAEEWLNHFFQERLLLFGPYQDAVHTDYAFLFHSLLSPLINTGLLTPQFVIKKSIELQEKVPLNSLEGFLRQLIGWREYIRAIYLLKGKIQKKTNFWHHHQQLPHSFWKGKTGVLPIDLTLKKVQQFAYAHHIERLMILGNFMFLCEISPEEIYQWFMTMFIDAYEWVMVPNVYGMSQFADGGLMSTKPYFSSSHYLKKMTNFPEESWSELWDGLYWRFVRKHLSYFQTNPRTRLLLYQYRKKNNEKLDRLILNANQFLKSFLNS